MKAVHFCTTDFGGAFKAASRINEAMNLCGADSGLYVRSKYHAGSSCTEVINTPVKSFISKSKNVVNLMLSKGEVITDAFGTDVTGLEAVKRADVVILHWVNSFVSYDTVKKLASMKPVIWVMHDMWPYTGGCHYDYGCGGFLKCCGNCPQIRSRNNKDISYLNFRKKRNMFNGSGVFLVSPSTWNLECAKKSAVTSGLEGCVIHNPLDTEIFKPRCFDNKKRKKRILFGAMGDSVHKWEGIRMIKKALEGLSGPLRDETELIIFGNGPDLDLSGFPVKTKSFGFIDKEEKLASLYSACDLFISPSTADNYPNTLLEAVCCGTPCVCFDIGGMGDIVVTGQTGYLARPMDTADLCRGIEYVLQSDLKSVLSDPARNRLLYENSYQNIGSEYIKLCSKLTDNR